MKIHAYAAPAPKKPLKAFEYTAEELGDHDVEIKITHCGICHSDVHLVDGDWGREGFPLVPGHEIIGTVTKKGGQVSHLKTGDRVGVGWQRGSCMKCEYCIRGEENFCRDNQATCAGHYGGFADSIRLDGRFAFLIPKSLKSEQAAPLLCGGITVYTPLRFYGVTPQMKIAVVGIGGLGHMALQFARAFGCEVTAVSSSPDKQKEALELGAHHFISSKEKSSLKEAATRFDFVLSTVSADLDWEAYIGMLRPKGRLCIVGASPGKISVPPMSLIMGNRSVCGSVIGNRTMIQEMLEFAALHGIHAQTEALPMEKANEAMDRVRANKARYRMVLKN